MRVHFLFVLMLHNPALLIIDVMRNKKMNESELFEIFGELIDSEIVQSFLKKYVGLGSGVAPSKPIENI